MEDKDAIILELRKIIEDLRQEITQLKKENADLKEQLRLNFQNSSTPPSSDHYPKKEKLSSQKEKPNHPGFSHKWFAKEDVTAVKQ